MLRNSALRLIATVAIAAHSAAGFSLTPGVGRKHNLGDLAVARGFCSSGSLVLRTTRGPAPLYSGTPMDQAKAMPPLDLTDENVAKALEEAKNMLGTIFGNSAENRNIGITGDVQLADIDGPFIKVRLVGRFWHKRADVLARVENYVLTRIPEAIEVQIEDPSQLDDTMVEGGYKIQKGEGNAGTAGR